MILHNGDEEEQGRPHSLLELLYIRGGQEAQVTLDALLIVGPDSKVDEDVARDGKQDYKDARPHLCVCNNLIITDCMNHNVGANDGADGKPQYDFDCNSFVTK